MKGLRAEKFRSAATARGLLVAITPVLICVALIGGSAHPAKAAANPTTTTQLGLTPNQVFTADMNGDGKLDIVVSGTAEAVLLGNGDGTFKPPIFSYPGPATAAVLADFNRDGELHLAVGSQYGGVTILLGNGDGTFRQSLFLSTDPVGYLAAADLVGNGRSDLAVDSFQTSATTVYLSNGDGTFVTRARYSSTGGGRVGLKDFNGDRKVATVRRS